MVKTNNEIKQFIRVVNPANDRYGPHRRFEVNIRIDFIMKELLEALILTNEESTDEFYRRIVMYVYSGAMYESWINFMLRLCLESHLDEAGLDLWRLIERNGIKEKYEFAKARIGDLRGCDLRVVNDVVQIRNRLMHFKDEPVSYDAIQEEEARSAELKDKNAIERLIQLAPNPRLYEEIMMVDGMVEKKRIIDLHSTLKSVDHNSWQR